MMESLVSLLNINPDIPIGWVILWAATLALSCATLIVLLVVSAIQWALGKWWWIDVGNDPNIPPNEKEDAERDAADSEQGPLRTQLPFSERETKWIHLYNHIRKGQIHPGRFKKIRRVDLNYIAGMSFPHPALLEAQRDDETEDEAGERQGSLVKLQGNVARAQQQLTTRNVIWAATAVVIAACLGALLR